MKIIPRIINVLYKHEGGHSGTKRLRFQWHILGYQIRLDFDKNVIIK